MFTVYVPKNDRPLFARFEFLCEAKRLPKSEVVVNLVRSFVEKEECKVRCPEVPFFTF